MPDAHAPDSITGLLASLGRRPRPVLIAETLCAVLLVGLADYLTGYEISFSIFYVAPITFAAWFIGWRFALAVSALSVACKLGGDLAAGAEYSSQFVLFWNTIISLAFNVVVAFAFSSMRSMQSELEAKVRARTAALTEQVAKRERLEKELLAVSEREQQRIGHDLHDSLCQHLTGTALAGQVLGEKLAAQARPEAGDADRIVALIEEGITMARNIARGLAPVQLEAMGLAAALGEFAKNTGERFKIDCGFSAPHPAPVDELATALHLFRIAQEATANAIRHGHAKQVLISLSAETKGLRMKIEDDGSGLPDPVPERRGMGLHIMQHRAAIIGAELTIRREPPGTVVSCFLADSAAKETP